MWITGEEGREISAQLGGQVIEAGPSAGRPDLVEEEDLTEMVILVLPGDREVYERSAAALRAGAGP